jgi:uncharacterized damage-inducible protein DinB
MRCELKLILFRNATGRKSLMIGHRYSQLVSYKQWADRGLYEVVGQTLERLNTQDAAVLLRVLDHIHVVDVIFQRHLQGLSHTFKAPRSEQIPEFRALADSVREIDDVGSLAESDFEQPVDFVFTGGKPARMRRGEIITHVCLHGTYHRDNAGIPLQKNGISPNDDRLTDFLSQPACNGFLRTVRSSIRQTINRPIPQVAVHNEENLSAEARAFAVPANASVKGMTAQARVRILASMVSLLATSLLGCAVAPEPRPTTEETYSEFVYESLGATPSIQLMGGRKVPPAASASSSYASAAENAAAPARGSE